MGSLLFVSEPVGSVLRGEAGRMLLPPDLEAHLAAQQLGDSDRCDVLVLSSGSSCSCSVGAEQSHQHLSNHTKHSNDTPTRNHAHPPPQVQAGRAVRRLPRQPAAPDVLQGL